MLNYLIRKAVYIVVGTGVVAAGGYLTGHPEISSWHLKDLAGAVEAAVAGAFLSGVLGGSLKK